MAKQKTHVCIHVTSTLSAVELVHYEVESGQFLKLDHEEIMFDPSTRDILEEDDRFKTVIKRLFDRNKVPLQTMTTLVFPSFFTRDFDIPEGVATEDLDPILISEAERFYVFKKVDPIIGYCPTKSGRLLYTAYPQKQLKLLEDAFTELRIPIVSIDCNYTAALRGMVAMGVVQEEVTNQLKWLYMMVSDYSVFMALVEGTVIEKTLETPVASQTSEEDEVINQIKEDFKDFCEFEVINKVVVVNNSIKFYSTLLVEKLEFSQVTVFDQNPRTLSSLGAQDAPFPCSLEAIGGALVKMFPQLPATEMCHVDHYESTVANEKRNQIGLVFIIIGALLFAGQFGISSLFKYFKSAEQQKSATLNREIASARASFDILPEVKSKLYVQEGIDHNYKVTNIIIKIAQTLPPNAWLNNVNLRASETLQTISVKIEGATLSSDTLNTYVQELNEELDQQKLTPNVLPKQDADGRRYFDFTLDSKATE